MTKYGTTDRSCTTGVHSWADIDLNTSDWLTVSFPALYSDCAEIKGYTGIVWVRKEINIDEDQLGNKIILELGNIMESDSTFFNGTLVVTGSMNIGNRKYIVSKGTSS